MFTKAIEYINTSNNIDIQYLNTLLPTSFNVKYVSEPIEKVTLNSGECLISVAYDTTRVSMTGLFESVSTTRLDMILKFNSLISDGLAEVSATLSKALKIVNGKLVVCRSFFNMSPKHERYYSILICNAESLLKYATDNNKKLLRIPFLENNIVAFNDSYYVTLYGDTFDIKTGNVVSDEELALLESKRQLLDIEI